jgi:hypothetical protein
MTCLFSSLAFVAVLTVAGPSARGQDVEESPDIGSNVQEQPRTLFDWRVPAWELEPESEEPATDEIATDRPDFTEASSTVGLGRVQLEVGYTFVRDREGGERLRAHSYPEALLRIGLFAEWFELRLAQNLLEERTIAPDGDTSIIGADDLYVGFKLALTEQKAFMPEMALVVQATLPTAKDPITAHQIQPGFNWLYGWDVIPGRLAVAGSTQFNQRASVLLLPDTDSRFEHAFSELAQSFTINYGLTDQLGGYTEWFMIAPHRSLDPHARTEHYFNGGFTYKVFPNLQLDVRAGIGLNRQAADFFCGSGFGARW